MDGDGFTNAQEATVGTNPNDPADFPCITSVSNVLNPDVYTTTVHVVWNSRPGLVYAVEDSVDLINWSANSPIRGSTGTVTTWTNTYPSWLPRKFFRLTVTQQDALDSDGDGLLDWEEQLLGTYPHYADTDGDGMPDEWEVINHLNPLVNDADLDPDGDQFTNLDEYLNGTDPNVGGGGGNGDPGAPTLATEADYTWLTNSASFTFSNVEEGHFTSGYYFLDNFALNEYSGEDGDHIHYTDYQTELWGQSGRFVNDIILTDAMAAYAQSFSTAGSTPDNDARRWLKNPSIAASSAWYQSPFPDQAENVALTDSAKNVALCFLSAQLNAIASYPQEMSRPIVIIDYPLLSDGSIDASKDPTMYSGSVTFTVVKNRWLPTSCHIQPGNLPTGVLSQITVASSAKPLSPRIAVQITLAAPSPNTRRVLLSVDALQPTITTTGTVGNLAPAGGVRLCRWNSLRSEDEPHNLADQASFPNADPDRLVIHLQLPHKSGAGTITVHVSTSGAVRSIGGADASYNDAGADLALTETNIGSGVFQSLPIAIVADQEDDHWNKGRNSIDGALNDPTFIGWPGGTVNVTGSDLPAPLKLPIKKFTHNFKVAFVFAGSPTAGHVADAFISRVSRLADCYAPLHVRADIDSNGGSIISDSDLADIFGDNEFTPDTELTALLVKVDALSLPDDDIKIVIIKESVACPWVGYTFYGHSPAPNRPDIVMISANAIAPAGVVLSSNTFAHECGHVLRGLGHLKTPGVYDDTTFIPYEPLPKYQAIAEALGNGIVQGDPEKSGKHWYISDANYIRGREPFAKIITP